MESLVSLRADLALFCNQPLDVAGRVTQSDARNFFDSQSFANWKKAREHQHKVDAAMLSRLDALIKGLSAIGKAR